MSRHLSAAALLLSALACSYYTPPPPPKPAIVPLPPARTGLNGAVLQDEVSGTTNRLQAVSVVSEQVVWASGAGGTFVVTLDGGRSWRAGQVPGADSLEFRDVHAFDGKSAYLLSSGNGTRSRIYRTVDGGVNWQLQFINRDTTAFYDCFSFWDERSGLAFSDNVRGVFPLLRTLTGGDDDWRYLSNPAGGASPLPAATPGEGGFAASGTCLITQGKSTAFIATGAGTRARILKTTDRGDHWTEAQTPVVQGTATTGLTSVAFRNAEAGIAVGGDIGQTESMTDNVAYTQDGGRSWSLGGRLTFAGAAYGAMYVPGTPASYVAIGPKGVSLTSDEGKSWVAVDTLSYWSAGFASRQAGWLVGPGGRITKISF